MRLPYGTVEVNPKTPSIFFRKHLSSEGLSQKLKNRFKTIDDSRYLPKVKIALHDALMAGFAMFSLKIPSLLNLDESRLNPARQANLKNLFGIKNIPSDTTMREILDEVNPADIRPAFLDIFSSLQRGKILDQYKFLDKYYLLSIDGTGYFTSDKIHCHSCLEKHHKATGKTTYHHQMLAAVMIHPDIKQVIPFCPEPIIKQDGEKKNDCERNACARILKKINDDHPKLKLIIVEDGLASNAPHIRDLKRFGMSFILGAKPGDHKFLFEEFQLAESRLKSLILRDENFIHSFEYVNGLQLNESSPDVTINFLQYIEFRSNKDPLTFSWVTDIEITDTNVYQLMRGGRARWKIENETFNTLKNQGYEFEHNYGHGNNNLSTVLSFLMMLAFFVDQVQFLSSKIVQQAVIKVKRVREFFFKIRALFDIFIFDSWADLYEVIASGFFMKFPTNTS